MGDDIVLVCRPWPFVLILAQPTQCSSVCCLRLPKHHRRQPVTEPDPMSLPLNHPSLSKPRTSTDMGVPTFQPISDQGPLLQVSKRGTQITFWVLILGPGSLIINKRSYRDLFYEGSNLHFESTRSWSLACSKMVIF